MHSISTYFNVNNHAHEVLKHVIFSRKHIILVYNKGTIRQSPNVAFTILLAYSPVDDPGTGPVGSDPCLGTPWTQPGQCLELQQLQTHQSTVVMESNQLGQWPPPVQ